MKTVNIFFYNGHIWGNAVGAWARQMEARIHAPDFRIVFGDKESDGDLVHYFDAGPADKGNRPGLMGVHQISPRMPGRMLADRAPALRRHLGVVVLTNAMADQVRTVTDRPVYVIPGGIYEHFVPATVGERMARIDREPFTVGLVGHLRHGKFDTKGSEALRNVMALCPDYRYRVAGHGWGDFAPAQCALGHDLRVVELPYEKMPSFYHGLDVLLCLSREEAGCLPILEALACGVPVISTRVGYAMLELFAVHRVGFLDDQFLADAQDVADALRAIESHRESTAQLGDKIAGTVSELTWQRCAERHEAMYREMLSA